MLLLLIASCSSHPQRINSPGEAEHNEMLLSAQTRETEHAESLAEARQLQFEVEALNGDQSERGLVLTLSSGVLFDTDNAVLKPDAGITLDRLAAFMNQFPERNLIVEGHTDSTGDDPYNVVLSLQRANAVRSYLVARGIEETRMRTRAMGENYPVAANDSNTGRQLNRRVEIVLSDQDGLFPAAAQRTAATQ
jgi:outer membrane protein OmpA-like peptidoglycan-associated protein